MPTEENNYTPEFKKKIAQQALDQSKQNLEQLSKEHNVPVSVILMWATELEKGGEEAFKEADKTEDKAHKASNTVDVTVSEEEVSSSIEYGVMSDNLNYKRLTFWSVLGIVLVLVFVQALFEMYQYNTQNMEQRVAAESGDYYQSVQLKKEANEHLNNFGVVNLEEGTYSMPIDSVINNMAVNEE
ncbi:transposase [Fodinibius salsisoli]|uniref:Transposase n=1 Tax=Fodinibius salsisoli TaxID=2820877 RepID=A0ABT3PSZ2_9BACT|nr:transposase [Fodinibius salsisoli]MCW9708981.1 transposase [Fodinibius salsisoli]